MGDCPPVQMSEAGCVTLGHVACASKLVYMVIDMESLDLKLLWAMMCVVDVCDELEFKVPASHI